MGEASPDAADKGDALTLGIGIKNTGNRAGKEVVQVYCQAPQGALGKAARVLCGFAKTGELQPGELQELEITVPVSCLASYDDSGVTGRKSCYVLEPGEYVFMWVKMCGMRRKRDGFPVRS